jgi:hypothetical protein
MPKIEFRGQTYNDEFEMPDEVRQAYIQEKARRAQKDNSGTKPLTDIVNMSPEVKAIYERAVGDVEDKLPSLQHTRELPKTEEIYLQSAPDDM